MHRLLFTSLTLLLIAAPGSDGRAAEAPGRRFDSTWVHAIEQMVRPEVDSAAYRLTDFVIQQKNFQLTIDSGLFYPFVPITASNDTIVYGGFFVGRATFDFRPSAPIEQDQLQRFFKSDTLTFAAWETALFFDSSTWRQIQETGVRVSANLPDRERRALEEFQKPLTRGEDYWFLFTTLRAAVYPQANPHLMVNCAFDEHDQVVYLYDPYHREQVRLFREHNVPGEEFMELICQYAETIDSSYRLINGTSTDQLSPIQYDIDAVLWDNGKLTAKTAVRYVVLRSSTQFVRMVLHKELKVDSITFDGGGEVPFLRYRDDDHKQQSLYVFFPRSLSAVDFMSLTFWYTGDIARRKVGQFHVEAGASWYPRYGYASRSTYTIRFRTPRDLTFIVSAARTDSTIVGDTLVTTWTVPEPAANIGFNIGHFTRYDYGTDSTPIDLYYNAPLHRSILKGSGQRVYKDVGADVEKSLHLFDSLFGDFTYPRLVVSEIVFQHGESFPGLLHLGANTFTGTDLWGNDLLFRAHEVAHQWFGSTVGYETYHDQWLSEGFAEYAALLYFRQEKGDDAFLDKIREYRKSVYSARKYLFFSGEESGPIIQGFRTASSKTKGDYDLIIYRKAALVLHMIHGLLTDLQTGNDSRFFDMMRAYVRKYTGQAVSTSDFQTLVQTYAQRDLSGFFQQWLYGNELPEVKANTKIEKIDGDRWEVRCALERRNVTDSFAVDFPIEIEFEAGPPVRQWVRLAQPVTDFRLSFERKPKKVRLNPFEFALISVK